MNSGDAVHTVSGSYLYTYHPCPGEDPPNQQSDIDSCHHKGVHKVEAALIQTVRPRLGKPVLAHNAFERRRERRAEKSSVLADVQVSLEDICGHTHNCKVFTFLGFLDFRFFWGLQNLGERFRIAETLDHAWVV